MSVSSWLGWVSTTVVITPDRDIYCESLSIPPLSGLRAAGPGAEVPFGLGVAFGQPVYRFARPLTERMIIRFLEEASELAEETRMSDLLRYAVAAPAPLALAGPLLPLAGAAAAMPAPPGPVADGREWFVVDTQSTWSLGRKVPTATVSAVGKVLQDTALIFDDDGNVVVLKLLQADEVDGLVEVLRDGWAQTTPRTGATGRSLGMPASGLTATQQSLPAPAEEDVRTLGVLRNSLGERYRDIRSLAERITQVEFTDWPLEGPRTTRWWLTEVSRSGQAPSARHNAWRHENSLKEDDHLTIVHEILSEVLELLGCVDQLDLGNLVGAESAVRHIQYIEHEIKKRAESKKTADSSEHFLGRHRRTGGALINPELLRWVAEKAMRDSQILKEQRKAAEERSLVKPPKK